MALSSNKKAAATALAVALAAPCEGLRQYAYRDPVGIPTICFGSTTGVKMGDFKTVPECQALLTQEMSDVVRKVDQCQPGLPVSVLAAFSDAAYNIGPTVACDTKASTAARLLKAGNFRSACEQLPSWNKARIAGVLVPLPGLTKRRQLERETCLQGLA